MQQSQHRSQYVAKRQLQGVGLELVNYEWNPGALIVHLETDLVLRLRLKQTVLRLLAFLT